MKNGGRTFAFVAGLTAGIMNLLLGLNALLGTLLLSTFLGSLLIIGVAYFLITAVNFAGGCACRSHRIPGGVMMLATAVPMLLIGAGCLFVPMMPSEMLNLPYGMDFAAISTRAMTGTGILMILIELVSIAAGVVSLTAREQPEYAPEAPRSEAESHEAVMSFAERYAARLNPNSGAASDSRDI